MLRAENVTVTIDRKTIVSNVSFSLAQGEWLMLAGPNGAGKSTLIRAIAQGVPYTGRISLMGRDMRTYKPAQIARQIGMLSQQHSVGYGYTVEEVVSLGRYAHSSGFWARGDEEGERRVNEALEMTGLSQLRHASVLTLSGGELQRTFLAQVFAQDPQILLLDEPANHLDLVYQKHIFSLIGEWLKTPGRAVLSVVHDLSLAKKYGTHAVLMEDASAVAQGEISGVLTEENLARVYGMDVGCFMRELYKVW